MYDDRSAAWDRALDDPKFLAATPETARLRLLELYDDTYGIIDHDADLSPFSLVSQVEQEDPLLVSGYGGYVDEYLKAGIKEHLDISFDTWMTYTYSKQKLLIARVEAYATAKNNDGGSKLNELERAFKEAQKLNNGG